VTIKIDEIMTAYFNMRDAIAKEERKFKEFKAGLKDQMETLELAIKDKLTELGTDSFKKAGLGTAFLATKDSVTINDKPAFLSFLTALMTLEVTGAPITAEEVVEKLHASGAFDLLTVSANKTNCKSYMAENDIMPAGVAYRTERVVQFRKGK
jgi:hypothetical protein